MADIDDELLALAGDASSDEDNDAPMNISRESSAAPNNKSSRKGTSRKSSTKKSSRRQNESEEEGEASSGHSSPNSLRSAPMDESDSEMESNALDQGVPYPYEEKFKDAADKAEIMALPEIKREQVLADRAEEIARHSQNRTLRALLLQRTEGEKRDEAKKRKAGDADLEDGNRKTSRQRTKLGGGKVGEASSGIDRLQRARAEKDDRQRRRAEDKERNRDRRHSFNDDFSDVDADGESDVEWDGPNARGRKRSSSPDYRDAEPASLINAERVRVGRTSFALVCFYPGFDEAITGCFVRVSIGVEKETGQTLYRMAMVKGFTEGKPYAIENRNGKRFQTTQYVRAVIGKAERIQPFISCSDSPFTEGEWNRYKQTCLAEDCPIPTKPKLISKLADVNALVNRSWTEAELQEKLKKSGALVNKFIPIERNRITNLLKEAKAIGDQDRVDMYTKELEELEGPKLAYSTSMHSSPKKSSTGPTQQERLAALNKENRRKNAEAVRQAQIAERKKVRETEAAIARGEVVAEDHSRRLKTRAKFTHNANETTPAKKDGSATATPSAGTPDLAAKKPSTPLPYLAKLQAEKKGFSTLNRPPMDDDIIGSIDLGLDIDI